MEEKPMFGGEGTKDDSPVERTQNFSRNQTTHLHSKGLTKTQIIRVVSYPRTMIFLLLLIVFSGAAAFWLTIKRDEERMRGELLTQTQLVAAAVNPERLTKLTGTKADLESPDYLREQYQSLVANIPGVTYRCALDHYWTMLYVSPYIKQLSGYPDGDFINNAARTYESIIHRQDCDRVADTIHTAARQGSPWDVEYRICHKSGEVRWVQDRGRGVVGGAGQVIFLDGVIMDITERKKIEQILANLCVNSRDAIQGHGKITIATTNIHCDDKRYEDVSFCVPGDYVMITIADNGCGMDKEAIGKLFEPFFTTKEFGTGLGLATVYGIVRQNGGFIEVDSAPGHGATFRICLPKHPEPPGESGDTDVEPQSPGGGGGETVLLVEDELSVLRMITRMLERNGYQVLAADKPGEAIRLANERQAEIKLVLSDVVMPEMNGLELAQNLSAVNPDIKCLFMSGYTDDIIAKQGVVAENVHFLQKPFSITSLGAKVREALDS